MNSAFFDAKTPSVELVLPQTHRSCDKFSNFTTNSTRPGSFPGVNPRIQDEFLEPSQCEPSKDQNFPMFLSYKKEISSKTVGVGKCPNFSYHPNIGDIISNRYLF